MIPGHRKSAKGVRSKSDSGAWISEPSGRMTKSEPLINAGIPSKSSRTSSHARMAHSPLRAARAVANVTKPTTLTLLSGMRMAAISGVRWPLTANDTPTTL